MASKRFELIANSPAIVLGEKSAVQIELQYGAESKPLPELVIAEKYMQDGEWKYSRTQIRLDCSKENMQALTDAIAAMYKAAAKVKKEPKAAKVTTALGGLSDAEKAELLKALLADASKASKPAAASKEPELVLENSLSNRGKRR